MNLEALRSLCLSLPQAREKIQWGDHLLFTVADKMFCITSLEPNNPTKLSFKCTPETFAELIERPDVIPAPYMARNFWVALEAWDALSPPELRSFIAESHQLIVKKLPKKARAQLGL